MRILVIDREDLTNQLISSKLKAKEHDVVVESNKNVALEKIINEDFGCIMLDPAPLSEARPIIETLWKTIKANKKPNARPYIILLSKTATNEEAILSGANDVLLKPLSTKDLYDKVDNAARFMEIYRYLGEEDDVKSGKGLINKAAFNQLFLSANSRAFRYGEVNFIAFLHLSNHKQLSENKQSDELSKTLYVVTKKLNLIRRQSDIIGMLSHQDYAILLQSPRYPAEPTDAVNRFCSALDRLYNEMSDKGIAPEFEIDLVEIPQGILHAHKATPYRACEFEEESEINE